MSELETPPKSIHIAPLGVENERISQPAIDYEADHIILLEYLPPVPPLDDIHSELTTALDEAGIEYERKRTDFDDLFEGLTGLAETIETQAGKNDIYVNVSSGNKVAAIAGMIACMVTGQATPYYVKAEENDSNFPQPSSGKPAQGIRSIETIPRYPMDRPETEHLAVMKFIHEQETELRDDDQPFVEKKKIIEFGEEEDLPFMSNYEGETEKGKYSRLRHHIIEPLEEFDYITIEEHGSSDIIKLTEDGRNTLRAFEYVVENK